MTGEQGYEDYRRRARAFIAENAPAMEVRGGHRAPRPEDLPALREWTAKMFAEGFLGEDWPPEYGGKGESDPMEDAIFTEELGRAGAPAPIGAAYLASGALLSYGTDEQKRKYLPRIRNGEDIWCQLFSEPNAGSDLAALRTQARLDGHSYVINGQKVWTTNAHNADLGYLLARTDTTKKHAGISAFILVMRSPGVEIRPLREITGTADFNEVFFTDVRVPAANLIGGPGEGWQVATASLVKERQGNRGLGSRLRSRLDDLLALAREVERSDPALAARLRPRLGRVIASTEVCNYLHSRSLERRLADEGDAADAPVSKIFSSEVNVAMIDLALAYQGDRGVLAEGDPGVLDGGSWQDDLLYSRTYTIAGGSNEILRNLIAERALGMPRDRSK
ncbi:acyl-CoA dehydrogenase family protein [Trebonia sp.]|uniref:acyl-CoA dehydrogenase family protein n=1 Tax=Trebonia sp. TaxID=2767075 RepID=UPI00260CE145|nr:acyl-CoA dehydrogenase family protein [Trebonia sp.]